MSADQEQQQTILKRVAARERAARIQSLAFTLIPLLVVGTLLTLSIRWITTSDREALVAREEATRYQQTLALSDKPSVEMAKQVLESQRRIAEQEEQLKAATEKVARLETTLQASNQTPNEMKELIARYEDAIRSKDQQIISAKDAGRAEEAKRSQEAIGKLAQAKDAEIARVRAEADREIKAAQDRATKAEQAAQGANELANQLNQCKIEKDKLSNNVGRLINELATARTQFSDCQNKLKNCNPGRSSDEQPSQTQDADYWKGIAIKYQQALDKCQKEPREVKVIPQPSGQTPP